jgi:hypothetical protein
MPADTGTLAAEYRNHRDLWIVDLLGAKSLTNFGDRGFFLTAAYRVNKRLEVGTYNSRYFVDASKLPAPSANHIFGSAQEFVGRAGIAELGLNSQFADG